MLTQDYYYNLYQKNWESEDHKTQVKFRNEKGYFYYTINQEEEKCIATERIVYKEDLKFFSVLEAAKSSNDKIIRKILYLEFLSPTKISFQVDGRDFLLDLIDSTK